MNKFKKTFLVLTTAASVLAFSLPSQASMSPYIKTALIDVCKAAKSNKVHRLNSTIKSHHLKNKTVALKVMCNGDDIISFAENYGATKTAKKLQKSLGKVNIIDVASTTKVNVTFTE
ncbi:MAG: DUF3718 domain-containing protein [Colwellia sp.]